MTALILAFLVSLLGGVLPLIKDWKNKKEKGHKKSNTVAILAVIILIAGSSLSFHSGCNAINEKNISDNLARVNDSLYKNLLKKNLNTTIKSLDATKIILDSSKKILEKQFTFAALQNESLQKLSAQTDSTSQVLYYGRKTIKFVLGDTTYPVMNVSVGSDSNNNNDIMIISYENKTDIPIYDLKVVLPHFKTQTDSLNIWGEDEKNIGTLTKNYSPIIFSKKFPMNDTLFGLTPIGTVWRTGYYISFVYFRKKVTGEISIETHNYNGKGEFKL